MSKTLTIALYDEKLFAKLQAMDFSEVRFKHLRNSKDECEADILLLDDAGVQRAAAHCGGASRPSFFVIVDANAPLPASYVDGIADDLLALPVRRVDIVRLIRFHHQILALRELENSSQTIPALVEKLQEDLRLAQKIQRRLIKEKFPQISGLKIKSKYWCGIQSGGDYFDVVGFPGNNHVGFLLSDSSSYALSANFLSSLMQFSLQTGTHDPADPGKLIEALYGKVREGMKEKEELSVLYGVLDKKTYLLRIVACGRLFALHQDGSGTQNWMITGSAPPLTKEKADFTATAEILLEPADRLVFLSDGWGEGVREPVQGLAERLSKANPDAQELMNEFAFSLRRSVEQEEGGTAKADDPFPMPPQDCSILVVEIAKNVLRLASA